MDDLSLHMEEASMYAMVGLDEVLPHESMGYAVRFEAHCPLPQAKSLVEEVLELKLIPGIGRAKPRAQKGSPKKG